MPHLELCGSSELSTQDFIENCSRNSFNLCLKIKLICRLEGVRTGKEGGGGGGKERKEEGGREREEREGERKEGEGEMRERVRGRREK